jgi:hypothetical protein
VAVYLARLCSLVVEKKDTWQAGIGASRCVAKKVHNMSFSYDSSPVSNGKRTIDLTMDNQFKLSAGTHVQRVQEGKQPEIARTRLRAALVRSGADCLV